ncbi:hypothetical protein GINT2_002042 [Glugoides intestinalis]
MNLAADSPSRIVEITITDPSSSKKLKGNVENPFLDFYTMNSDAFYKAQVKKSTFSLIFDAVEVKMEDREVTASKKCTSLNVQKPFILEVLKNDRRIQSYKLYDSSVVVYFKIVDEAISFYKHYFQLISMKFIEEYHFRVVKRSNCQVYEGLHSKPITINYVQELLDDRCPFKKTYQIWEAEQASTSPKESFFKRIEYFNKLRNIYSKAEVKKVQEENCVNPSSVENYIFTNAKELSVGVYSNVIIQQKVQKMTEDQLCDFINSLGSDIAAISATKHGAYTIQTLIDVCQSVKTKQLICKEFGEVGLFLICHDIGNYSIQKVLSFDEEYAFNIIIKGLESIIQDQLGFKVLKKCIVQMKNSKLRISPELLKIRNEKNADNCDILNKLLS